MAHWRHTAASAVAVSAVLFSGQATAATAAPVAVSQDARQGFQAATRIAAQSYRQQRRRILDSYREATRAAHTRLRTAMLHAGNAEQRQAAWRAYSKETAPLRADANRQMVQARVDFRETVERAREQFGIQPAPRTFATIR